jgi:hypothetical protein
MSPHLLRLSRHSLKSDGGLPRVRGKHYSFTLGRLKAWATSTFAQLGYAYWIKAHYENFLSNRRDNPAI